MRGRLVISSTDHRINRQIRAREVRLIVEDDDGKSNNIGIVPIGRAIEMAEERNLDLVEVSPNADPPVCKIMDFGKFQYEKQRRERKARKQQKNVEIKEFQLGPKTDEHHLGIKVRRARSWIESGMKVRVRVKFKGREITHPDIGRERLDMIASEMADIAQIEQRPNLEGRNMIMILAPLSDKN